MPFVFNTFPNFFFGSFRTGKVNLQSKTNKQQTNKQPMNNETNKQANKQTNKSSLCSQTNS